MNASKLKIISDAVETTEGRYVPHEIRDPKSALQASLHVILNHTADMFVCVVQAISEKYGHPVEEMMEAVKAHPGYKEMMVSPVLHDLGYLTQEKKLAALAPVVVAEDPGPAALPPKLSPLQEAKEMTDAWRAAKAAARTRSAPPPPPLPPLRKQQSDSAALIAEIDEILLAGGPVPQPRAPSGRLPPIEGVEQAKKFVIRPRVKAAWVGAGAADF